MYKQKILFLILFLFLMLAVLLGLVFLFRSDKNFLDNSSQKKPQVIVSILPQAQIVKKIAGSTVKVSVLIPPGFDPATYSLTTKDIKTIMRADIYFRIGYIDFEKINLDKFREINPNMLMVDTSAKNVLRKIDSHADKDQKKISTNNNNLNQQEIDPHVWLSPKMVKQQAKIIKNSLVQKYPKYKLEYENNYHELSTQLDNLDKQLKLAFAPIKGKTMLVYHPAFGYLADEYDFTQEYIQIRGKDPSVKELQTIINWAKKESVRVIFVQKQFGKDSAQSIAENIGGVVVEIDPLDPDYLSNIENLARTISLKLVE